MKVDRDSSLFLIVTLLDPDLIVLLSLVIAESIDELALIQLIYLFNHDVLQTLFYLLNGVSWVGTPLLEVDLLEYFQCKYCLKVMLFNLRSYLIKYLLSRTIAEKHSIE